MADTSEIITTSSTKTGFIGHVFNFDDNTKTMLLNLFQYVGLAIIPVIVLNKTIQKYFPAEDTKKPSLEIGAEVLGQLVVLVLGIVLIHRLITFVPTYSKKEYPTINLFCVLIVFLIILFSLQTKIGKKVNILVERVYDYFGTGAEKKPSNEEQEQQQQQQNGPIPQDMPKMPMDRPVSPVGQPVMAPQPRHQPSRSDEYARSMGQPNMNTRQEPERQPNFNNMFSNNVEPFVGGASSSLGGSVF